jgi:glycosyltransferase involved in cell wall biosynthesis
LALVLTGTDLYRDILTDPSAQRSLALARWLVVLQERGPRALPMAFRFKTRVLFQSSPARSAINWAWSRRMRAADILGQQKLWDRHRLVKSNRHLRVLMVGHLRDEKSPETLFAAARLLAGRDDIFIDHIGAALDPALGAAAQATMAAAPRYRWLGARTHQETRRRIQQAHALVHSSRMEGGAHAILEAVVSGTPVLASRVEGNLGMLGDDYGGYFPWGDAHSLTDLLIRCRLRQGEGEGGGLLRQLADQCARRAPLFHPAAERAALRRLVDDLFGDA